MIVLIINFSGNVGKSTLARHLFLPRMNNAEIISFESINSNDDDSEQFRGKQFGDLIKHLPLHDNAIIDVGASNIEDFINLMESYEGSHEFFDYFIIPTVSKPKQIKDTISTINALTNLGVPSKKIIPIFNMIEKTDDVEKLFSSIFNIHKDKKSFTLKSDAVIHENELYTNIKDSSKSIDDLLNDKTDYKAAIAQTDDKKEKVRLMHFLADRMLAKTVKKELDTVYKIIIK